MSDLTDEQLESLEYHGCSSGTGTPPILRDAIVRAVAEVRLHRAAVRADRERVRATVVAAVDVTAVENVDGGRSSWTGKFIDAIADRVADALASPAPALPPRKEWTGNEEGSDYVDGWNDAIDATERLHASPVSASTAERVRSVVRDAYQAEMVARGYGASGPQATDIAAFVNGIADRAAERLAGAGCATCGDPRNTCRHTKPATPPSEAARGAVLSDEEHAVLDRLIAAHRKAP
jgi:hypothetical protein